MSNAEIRAAKAAEDRRGARLLLVASAVLLLLVAALAALSYQREAPLRAGGLDVVQGEVVQLVRHRSTRNALAIRYQAPTGTRTAEVPVSLTRVDPVAPVDLLLDPGDDSHVRTVTSWRPYYAPSNLVVYVVPLLLVMIITTVVLVRRPRG